MQPLRLIRTAGIVNALFVLFHLWLGWQFHHWAQLPAGLRALLEIFNACGTLFILFLAVVALAFPREAAATALGRLTLWLGAALYAMRGLAEFVVTPQTNLPIVATCFATALLYAAILWIARPRLASA
ncbi:MAG TPA: hypothetical protein PKK58_12745 [Opitutaceae bacterium]|nr:hypothetical protein [Opitutaceae bacterium]